MLGLADWLSTEFKLTRNSSGTQPSISFADDAATAEFQGLLYIRLKKKKVR